MGYAMHLVMTGIDGVSGCLHGPEPPIANHLSGIDDPLPCCMNLCTKSSLA